MGPATEATRLAGFEQVRRFVSDTYMLSFWGSYRRDVSGRCEVFGGGRAIRGRWAVSGGPLNQPHPQEIKDRLQRAFFSRGSHDHVEPVDGQRFRAYCEDECFGILAEDRPTDPGIGFPYFKREDEAIRFVLLDRTENVSGHREALPQYPRLIGYHYFHRTPSRCSGFSRSFRSSHRMTEQNENDWIVSSSQGADGDVLFHSTRFGARVSR